MRALLLLTLGSMVSCSCSHQATKQLALPSLMLWAWQRPETLTFINTRTTGVAYLAGTARITRNGLVLFEPRLQPLALPPGASLLPVVRIESVRNHPSIDTAVLINMLKSVASAHGIRGLQIDFDARASERPLYQSLLRALTDEIPVPVSITALASWCEGDRWLDRTRLAEAVPMFFQMGAGERIDMAVTATVCTGSIGLSTNEPWPLHRPASLKRLYLFSPRAWTEDRYTQILERLRHWK